MRAMAVGLILFFLFSLSSWGESEKKVSMEVSSFEVKGESLVAISLAVASGWHIYWKNPGDAGLAPQFSWFKGEKKIEITPLEWPAPKKYREGAGLVVYGYGGLMHFFFKIPRHLRQDFAHSSLELRGKWLVCSEICIPGAENLEVNFLGDLTLEKGSAFHREKLLDALYQLPKEVEFPRGMEMSITRDDQGALALNFSLPATLVPSHHPRDQILYPFPHPLFDFGHEELFVGREKGKIVGRFPLEWKGEYLDPVTPLPKDGVFNPPLRVRFLFYHPSSQKREVVQSSLALLTWDSSQKLKPFSWPREIQHQKNQRSLFLFLLFAFLGGVILNFMPCVLPVVSLKLFSIIRSEGAGRAELFRHNLTYTAGVLFSFLCLAIVLIGFKSAGQVVGWGFQLQSPHFVAAMIVLLLVFSLNLFGLFEFRTLGGKWWGEIDLQRGWFGDFASGVLATILSTPCSAPFLGTALAFAFASSSPVIILIFFSVGMGLSLPFLLTALFPKALTLMPRPGKWMEDLKKFLGLTLLLTIVWLYDVFLSVGEGQYSLLLLNLTLVTLFFAVYFHHRMGRKAWLKIFLYFLPLVFFISLMGERKADDLIWQPWSEEAMEELKGEIVFANFTADWCLTCKVNEKLVLQTKGFKKLIQERGVKLLLADWTKKNPVIAKFLQRHGHVGVPVYLIQKRNGQIVSLGETISLGEIIEHLE